MRFREKCAGSRRYSITRRFRNCRQIGEEAMFRYRPSQPLPASTTPPSLRMLREGKPDLHTGDATAGGP